MAKYDARKTSAQRGYGYRWQIARLSFLRSMPLCVMCQARNVLTPASVVDHIKPHKGDQTLFWDRSNWQSLCKPCHDSDKRLIELGSSKTRQRIGPDGYPVT